MIKTKKKFEGLSALSKSLNALTEKNFRKNALLAAGRKAMIPMLNDAKSNAPILSPENAPKNKNISAGTLKNSIKYRGKFNDQPIHITKGKNTGQIKSLTKHEYVGMIYTGKESSEYALPIEYGREEYTVVRIHVFGKKVNPYEATMIAMKPNPFMRNALDKNSSSVITRYMNELSLEIKKKAKTQENRIKKRNK